MRDKHGGPALSQAPSRISLCSADSSAFWWDNTRWLRHGRPTSPHSDEIIHAGITDFKEIFLILTFYRKISFCHLVIIASTLKYTYTRRDDNPTSKLGETPEVLPAIHMYIGIFFWHQARLLHGVSWPPGTPPWVSRPSRKSLARFSAGFIAQPKASKSHPARAATEQENDGNIFRCLARLARSNLLIINVLKYWFDVWWGETGAGCLQYFEYK